MSWNTFYVKPKEFSIFLGYFLRHVAPRFHNTFCRNGYDTIEIGVRRRRVQPRFDIVIVASNKNELIPKLMIKLTRGSLKTLNELPKNSLKTLPIHLKHFRFYKITKSAHDFLYEILSHQF